MMVQAQKELKMSVGERVEDLHCNGFPPGVVLTAGERAQIAAWTARFEECCHKEAELLAMSDQDMVATAYGVMADYARSMM